MQVVELLPVRLEDAHPFLHRGGDSSDRFITGGPECRECELHLAG